MRCMVPKLSSYVEARYLLYLLNTGFYNDTREYVPRISEHDRILCVVG